MTKEAKFRPYLSGIEMHYIIQLINKANDGTQIAAKIKYQLSKILLGADSGMATPAYVTSPQQSTLDKLGESCLLTVSQKREAAYIKYQGSPELCNDDEITLARTYMYEHNMLTESERTEYEATYLS